MRILDWSYVLRSFAISQVCGFVVSNCSSAIISFVALLSRLPSTTVRALHFSCDKTSALSPLVDN